jgi:hypothetical protein
MIASLTCLILCAEKTLFRNHAGSRTNATLSLLETNLTREDRRELRDPEESEFWTAINYAAT